MKAQDKELSLAQPQGSLIAFTHCRAQPLLRDDMQIMLGWLQDPREANRMLTLVSLFKCCTTTMALIKHSLSDILYIHSFVCIMINLVYMYVLIIVPTVTTSPGCFFALVSIINLELLNITIINITKLGDPCRLQRGVQKCLSRWIQIFRKIWTGQGGGQNLS